MGTAAEKMILLITLFPSSFFPQNGYGGRKNDTILISRSLPPKKWVQQPQNWFYTISMQFVSKNVQKVQRWYRKNYLNTLPVIPRSFTFFTLSTFFALFSGFLASTSTSTSKKSSPTSARIHPSHKSSHPPPQVCIHPHKSWSSYRKYDLMLIPSSSDNNKKRRANVLSPSLLSPKPRGAVVGKEQTICKEFHPGSRVLGGGMKQQTNERTLRESASAFQDISGWK